MVLVSGEVAAQQVCSAVFAFEEEIVEVADSADSESGDELLRIQIAEDPNENWSPRHLHHWTSVLWL